MSLRRTSIVLLGLTLIIAAGCTREPDSTSSAEAQRMTVSFGDALVFDPPTLTVRAGEPVVLTVKNTGRVDHDFYVRGMPVRDVQNALQGGHGHDESGTVAGHPKAGGQVTIRFTPITAGTFEFWCSVTGHKEAGMRGTITVS